MKPPDLDKNDNKKPDGPEHGSQGPFDPMQPPSLPMHRFLWVLIATAPAYSLIMDEGGTVIDALYSLLVGVENDVYELLEKNKELFDKLAVRLVEYEARDKPEIKALLSRVDQQRL